MKKILNISLKNYCLLIPLLLILSFSFTGFVNSSDLSSTTKSDEETKSIESVDDEKLNQKGLKAYIDPDTGELISAPEKDPETVQPNNSVFGGSESVIQQPEEIVHPDGSATVVMPDSFQHSTKISIDDKGETVTECVRKHEHETEHK